MCLTFMSKDISKREGKIAKDGTGMKVYIKPEEAQKAGIALGDNVSVVVNPDGTITIKPAAPPNLYEKFLQNAIDGGVEFGDPIEVGDSYVIPILTKSEQAMPRDYITVPEAIAMGQLRFTDTGGIQGVHVTNTGNMGVLVLQGQVFEGATQPRTIITNMILAPNQDVVLPARCVHSSHPINANAKMTIAGMSPRNVSFSLMTPQSKVDQQRVWGEVGCIMGTCVTVVKSFKDAGVVFNTDVWHGSNDLTHAMHEVGQAAMFACSNVDAGILRREKKFQNR